MIACDINKMTISEFENLKNETGKCKKSLNDWSTWQVTRGCASRFLPFKMATFKSRNEDLVPEIPESGCARSRLKNISSSGTLVKELGPLRRLATTNVILFQCLPSKLCTIGLATAQIFGTLRFPLWLATLRERRCIPPILIFRGKQNSVTYDMLQYHSLPAREWSTESPPTCVGASLK